ncbi:Protein C12orf4-like protein [Dirofilaria immitis]|nr:Protein C12orf4-like protein [Dirofilaria immitis]
MISDLTSENDNDQKRIRRFEYTARYKTLEQKVTFDAEIPLTDEHPIDEIISHIYVTNKVLPIFYEDIANAFHRFIDDETWKYETEIGDAIINEFLDKTDATNDPPYVQEFSKKTNDPKSSEALEFANQFQFIMQNSSPERLKIIIALERKMENAMLSLIRARDFELDRMYRKCEQAVNASITKDDQVIPESGQHLSRLNEQIRETSKNYAEQIRTLTSQQRKCYRNLIKSLYEHDKFPAEVESELSGDTAPVKRFLPTVSSLDSVKTQANFSLDESFTIYLGAQLKTMHNARLLTSSSLADLCRPPLFSEDSDTSATRRLQMNLTLYGRNLSSLILLVERDPMFHINERTDFSRLCEHSTELHFESLEDQLKQISPLISEAKKDIHHETNDDDNNDDDDDESLLPVIYHLVVDKSLEDDEISSRHPCINGLRNAIRLSAKCGVTTFTIPLLLVDKAKQHMTPNWCMKRAELIFKCVKGFMMEACSGSSTAGGGPPTATTHFNVNFVLPEDLEKIVYTEILELFPTIFHMVPSVVM